MATIKMTRKDYSYMNTVTESSLDNIYVPYENIVKTHTAVDFDLSLSDYNFFRRNKNNLIIVSVFSSGKVVTNTVKNYFKLAQKYDWLVRITESGDFSDAGTYNLEYVLNHLKPNTQYGFITDNMNISTEYLLGTSKNDTYKLSNLKASNAPYQDYVFDLAGNDNYLICAYNVSYAHNCKINDFKGNDDYVLSRGSDVKINEIAGNDTYNFSSGSKYDVNEYAGNDKYTIYNADDGSSSIIDYKGNDNYNIVKANYATITDDAGNDKYVINASESVDIIDKAGKDKYNIAYTVDLNLQDGLLGETKGGNDIYNLSYISKKNVAYSQVTDFAGNDKYNIEFSNNLYVYDKKGSDSYVIKDSVDNIKIFDEGKAEKVGKKMNNKLANDKYTLVNSNIEITETEGADTYKLINSKAVISDNGGNDKYNVTGYLNKLTTEIKDYTASSDTYNITNTRINVTDKGGKIATI